MKKMVQIVSTSDIMHGIHLVALCSDGSLWKYVAERIPDNPFDVIMNWQPMNLPEGCSIDPRSYGP